MRLVIGNKNYSSWSMRPWVLLRHFGIDFEEIRIALFQPGYKEELANYSASLRVPVLIDGDLTVWDSLAICEYLSENYLDGAALPRQREARALCRSYCCEMHGGFQALRNRLPMNCRARRRVSFDAAVEAEYQRVDALWADARARFGGQGDYLFGGFSMADCFYAPVVMRFHGYGVPLSSVGAEYLATMLENPAVVAWREAAGREAEVLEDFEIGTEMSD